MGEVGKGRRIVFLLALILWRGRHDVPGIVLSCCSLYKWGSCLLLRIRQITIGSDRRKYLLERIIEFAVTEGHKGTAEKQIVSYAKTRAQKQRKKLWNESKWRKWREKWHKYISSAVGWAAQPWDLLPSVWEASFQAVVIETSHNDHWFLV